MKAHAGEALTPDDMFFNPLPMFHSFGLTAGLLTAVLNGMKAVLYPSPLHYGQVPKLIGGTRATILLATDTFLQGYARASSFYRMENAKALGAGLSFRPLAETIADSLAWERERRARPLEKDYGVAGEVAGLSPEREAEVLHAWRERV